MQPVKSLQNDDSSDKYTAWDTPLSELLPILNTYHSQFFGAYDKFVAGKSKAFPNSDWLFQPSVRDHAAIASTELAKQRNDVYSLKRRLAKKEAELEVVMKQVASLKVGKTSADGAGGEVDAGGEGPVGGQTEEKEEGEYEEGKVL